MPHRLQHFIVKKQEKPGVLLYVLEHIIEEGKQTVIFAATKHHVDYLKELLTAAGIDCTYVYGSLDPTGE